MEGPKQDGIIAAERLNDLALEGTKKHLFLIFNVCPILSHSSGHEKLRTVFGIDIACLEGPPQHLVNPDV